VLLGLCYTRQYLVLRSAHTRVGVHTVGEIFASKVRHDVCIEVVGFGLVEWLLV
jgi:hypothetical protein